MLAAVVACVAAAAAAAELHTNPPLTAARTVAADAAARRGRPLVTPEPRHTAATPGLRAALEEAEALGKPRAPAAAASCGAPAVEKALRFDDGAGYATRGSLWQPSAPRRYGLLRRLRGTTRYGATGSSHRRASLSTPGAGRRSPRRSLLPQYR